MTKIVFVVGGVTSSVGKGMTAASLGTLLTARGLRVTMQKIDPYLNVDPGTLSPYEHGEVFVTEDGAETDLDLGHYERGIDSDLDRRSSVTGGDVLRTVLANERRGDYLGETVRQIPHVADEIARRISILTGSGIDVLITELGGTLGDYELLPFLAAIRSLRRRLGPGETALVLVTCVPAVGPTSEQKTKPTQQALQEMWSHRLQPDVMVARTTTPLHQTARSKLAAAADLPADLIVDGTDVPDLRLLPSRLHGEGLDETVVGILGLPSSPSQLPGWCRPDAFGALGTLHIGVVGKYIELRDAYISVVEALRHATSHRRLALDLTWIDAEELERHPDIEFDELDGVVIPGGFGGRGVEGKVAAAAAARRSDVPCLGLCLGMHAMVIDVARSLLGLEKANSVEVDPRTPHPVIHLMSEYAPSGGMGASMRLGSYPARLRPGTLVEASYGVGEVTERHRHRYELNNMYRDALEAAGLVPSGVSPDGRYIEFVELRELRFWVGTQAHPELKSRPARPHPLFQAFIAAASDLYWPAEVERTRTSP